MSIAYFKDSVSETFEKYREGMRIYGFFLPGISFLFPKSSVLSVAGKTKQQKKKNATNTKTTMSLYCLSRCFSYSLHPLLNHCWNAPVLYGISTGTI